RPSQAGRHNRFRAANPCNFGLSPKFSTPVEKTVEKRGEAPANLPAFVQANESLGRDPRAHRNEGQPPLVLYLVPADGGHYRGRRVDHRARPERHVQGVADEALFWRDG